MYGAVKHQQDLTVLDLHHMYSVKLTAWKSDLGQARKKTLERKSVFLKHNQEIYCSGDQLEAHTT